MSQGWIAAALLVLAGCASNDAADLPHPSSVDWSQYAPAVKERIDTARQHKDCAALQRDFDDASGSDLLEYIDASLKYAGCYY